MVLNFSPEVKVKVMDTPVSPDAKTFPKFKEIPLNVIGLSKREDRSSDYRDYLDFEIRHSSIVRIVLSSYVVLPFMFLLVKYMNFIPHGREALQDLAQYIFKPRFLEDPDPFLIQEVPGLKHFTLVSCIATEIIGVLGCFGYVYSKPILMVGVLSGLPIFSAWFIYMQVSLAFVTVWGFNIFFFCSAIWIWFMSTECFMVIAGYMKRLEFENKIYHSLQTIKYCPDPASPA